MLHFAPFFQLERWRPLSTERRGFRVVVLLFVCAGIFWLTSGFRWQGVLRRSIVEWRLPETIWGLGEEWWSIGQGEVYFWGYGAQRLQFLERENENLRARLVMQEALQEENASLKDALNLSVPEQSVQAETRGSVGAFFVLAGCEQGVQTGDAVVRENVLVGKIHTTSQRVSKVDFLGEDDWRVAVRIGTASAVGVFQMSRGKAEVVDVRGSERMEPGDGVRTLGDASLPADLVVGTIESVEKLPGLGVQRADVRLLADFQRQRVVNILTKTTENTCNQDR